MQCIAKPIYEGITALEHSGWARARAAMSEDDVLDDDADREMEQACVVKDR